MDVEDRAVRGSIEHYRYVWSLVLVLDLVVVRLRVAEICDSPHLCIRRASLVIGWSTTSTFMPHGCAFCAFRATGRLCRLAVGWSSRVKSTHLATRRQQPRRARNCRLRLQLALVSACRVMECQKHEAAVVCTCTLAGPAPRPPECAAMDKARRGAARASRRRLRHFPS